MRYLWIVVTGLVFIGCFLSHDQEKSEELGYSVGMGKIAGDTSEIWIVSNRVGTWSSGDYDYFADSTLIRIYLADSLRIKFGTIESFQKVISKDGNIPAYNPFDKFYTFKKTDTTKILLINKGGCLTWDQRRFQGKVPCIPILGIKR